MRAVMAVQTKTWSWTHARVGSLLTGIFLVVYGVAFSPDGAIVAGEK